MSRPKRARSRSTSSCTRPFRLPARPLVELVNQITVGWLPADIRRQYGFRWDPLRAVALRGGAEYVRRIAVPTADRVGIGLRLR